MDATVRQIERQRQSALGNKNNQPRPNKPRFFLPLNIAFCLCLFSHVLAAFLAPIQDCDETYNYWEPLHYLNHGYGLQTWETAPQYALRSWAYIVIHAIPAKFAHFFTRSKTAEFYVLRILLAFCCAATETRLYSAICRNLNPRVGIIYLLIVAFTPGMFYASAAFLPSSFAMYTSTLGLAAFVDWQRGSKTALGIMWFGIGAILGWPFSGVLIAPFMAHELFMALVTRDYFEIFRRVLDGIVRCLVVLGLQCAIDAFFYRQFVIVPWRLVAYNIFGGKDRGPDIFGTEPWHYYIRNLLLNFNIWFILASVAAPLVLLQHLFSRQQGLFRTSVLIAPFYLWFGILNYQAHKEERFWFCAYPFLAINAAIAFHIVLESVGSARVKIPPKLKLVVMLLLVLVSVNLGLLRIVGTVTAYRAPLQIYQALESPGRAHPGDTVCFGKDWYRFPSSMLLPNGVHAKFVKSEFSGLLPGEFSEASIGFGFFPGTWLPPRGMNDRNEEDPSKHTSIAHCTYLVDTHMPGSEPSKLEPDYALDESTWEKVSCASFLDTSATGQLARTIWIPDLPMIPVRYRRKWGEHCLLRRRS